MNIEYWLEEVLGFKPKASGRPGNRFYRIPCPSCDWDSNYNRQIWIRIDGKKIGRWACWRCEKGGDEIALMMHLEGIPYHKAKEKVELFSKIYGDADQDFKNLTEPSPKHQREGAKEAIVDTFYPESIGDIKKGSRVQKYLQKRGFNKNDVEDWGLRYCNSGKYRYRVMMPVYSEGKIRAWQGRDITGRSRLPYLATSEEETGCNIKHLLLNIDRVSSDLVVLVEGWTDVMAVGKGHGACLLGKGITVEQFGLLRKKKPKRVIVVLDGDALHEADDMASDLRTFTDAVFLQLPYGKDPASMGKERFWEYVNERI